jgi:hypothetical protein
MPSLNRMNSEVIRNSYSLELIHTVHGTNDVFISNQHVNTEMCIELDKHSIILH